MSRSDRVGAGGARPLLVDVADQHDRPASSSSRASFAPTEPVPWTSTVRPAGSSRPECVRERRPDAVEDAERGVHARIAGAAVADAAAEDVRRPARRSRPCPPRACSCPGRSRSCRRATRSGRRSARAGAAARRRPEPPARRAPPCRRRTAGRARPACASSRRASRSPSSSACRGSSYVFSRVPPMAGPSRVEWMQTNIQAPVACVVADDDVLAVPPPQQVLEHARLYSARTPAEAARSPRRAPRPASRARGGRSRGPAPPKPSPGATATRCSASSRSNVSPSGSGNQTKNVPSQRAPGIAASARSRRRS